jgi:hypothetical protein
VAVNLLLLQRRLLRRLSCLLLSFWLLRWRRLLLL